MLARQHWQHDVVGRLRGVFSFFFFFGGGGEVMVAACFQGSEKILRGVFCSIFGTRHTHTHNCQNFRKDSSGRMIMFVNLREINMEHLFFMSLLGKETSFLPL